MRIFYVYRINEFYRDMYYKHSYRLYKILEQIYYERDYDRVSSYRLYKQVIIPVNRLLCNSYVTKNHRLSYEYCYDNHVHYIKKNDEHTKMVISNIHIKIISDINYPSFFDDIYAYDSNIFICDFDNNDYFWLDKVINRDRQSEITIVK